MDAPSILAFLGFAAACVLAGSMGVLFPPGEWYERLAKPSWRPPNWLFAPAWTFLYACIAVAGWLVWLKAGFTEAAVPLAVYFLQLFLNALWTPIFFGLHRKGLAVIEIGVLWLAIAATILLFAPVDGVAAALLLPYLAWVTFASALTFAVWRLNRDQPA
jgi:tryptophan-rich sensory protein